MRARDRTNRSSVILLGVLGFVMVVDGVFLAVAVESVAMSSCCWQMADKSASIPYFCFVWNVE